MTQEELGKLIGVQKAQISKLDMFLRKQAYTCAWLAKRKCCMSAYTISTTNIYKRGSLYRPRRGQISIEFDDINELAPRRGATNY